MAREHVTITIAGRVVHAQIATGRDEEMPRTRTSTKAFVSWKGEPIAFPGAARVEHTSRTQASYPWVAAVMEVLQKAKGSDAALQFRFSYKAGCRCGCSPGFVVKGFAVAPADIYIEIGRSKAEIIEDAEKKVTADAAAAVKIAEEEALAADAAALPY
jgi:hypothetical protein